MNIKNKVVLIAEDMDVISKVLGEMLYFFGAEEVVIAENGQKAWEIFDKRSDLALLITDHEMPEMNGIELIKKIRSQANKEKADIPIIFLTGKPYTETLKAAKTAGANESDGKPITLENLIDLIENCK